MFATSSFIPVSRGTYKVIAQHDRFGRSAFADRGSFGFSIIKLDLTIQPTSIRTDKSGSKSFATEEVAAGRILSDVELPHGAIVSIRGQDFQVIGVFPRHDMDGRVNHWQVDLALWR